MQASKLVFAFVLFISITAAAEDPKPVPSTLKTVTVYRSGAEMLHNAAAQLPQGNSEMIIEGIANTVDAASIQINAPAAVTILSVEFGNNFLVAPQVSAAVKALQDSGTRLQRELDKVAVQITTTTDLLEVLKANRDIKGQQTGLSVAELIKLMDYYKLKSGELQNELVTYREKQKLLLLGAARIRTQIAEEESKNNKTRGQLRLQLSVATAGRNDFAVSYITPNAYWTPYYDVRVEGVQQPLKLIYKAKIVQTTGIDWKKVKLSLSTSQPSQWGTAPVLKQWFLAYINPVRVMERDLARNRIQSMDQGLQGRVAGLNMDDASPVRGDGFTIRGAATAKKESSPLYIVNGAEMTADEFAKLSPSAIKNVNVLKDASATSVYGSRAANGVVVVTLKDGLEDYVSVTDNELNVTFDIDLPYDVATNGKEQSATLREYSVPAFYKYYSVPKLDKDAYLLAEVADWESLNLLPGEANIIFEGTYVGKSFIDPASTADTLNLTLGRDKRLVVKKEKLADYSSVKFLGSNKLQSMTYEITVKNNKRDTVHLLLKDQYPLSTTKDIEVTLLDAGNAANNAEIGVLTWKLDLAPGESRKVRFAYSVKYAKDKAVNL